MADLSRVNVHGTTKVRLGLLCGPGVKLPHHPAGPFNVKGQHTVGMQRCYRGLAADIDLIPVRAAGDGAFTHRMVDHRGVETGTAVQAAPLLLRQLDHDVLSQGAINLIVGVGGMQVPPPGLVGAEEIAVLNISASEYESEGVVPEPGLVCNRGLPKLSGHRGVLPDST